MSALVFKASVDPLLCTLSPACNGFLRFTSGTKPADFLMTSMAAYMHVAEVGCRETSKLFKLFIESRRHLYQNKTNENLLPLISSFLVQLHNFANLD